MSLSYHMQPVQAVFFDRDGTLIKDEVYLADPTKVTLLEGVSEVISTLRQSGVLCFIVSNQSGVGRGLMWHSDVYAVNSRMDAILWEVGRGVVSRHFLCFHRPEEMCECRKPHPFLLQKGCDLYGLNPKACWMIGDRDSDIEAGERAGMNTFFIGAEHASATASGQNLKDWLALLLPSKDRKNIKEDK